MKLRVAPNMRLQRTRSSPSALCSPLTRGPVGDGKRCCLGLALGFFVAVVTVFAEERSVTIFEGRKISLSVPQEWRFEESRDSKTGLQTIQVVDPTSEVRLDVSFFPDAEGRVATRQGLEAEMTTVFAFYRAGAVEQEMKLTTFDAPDGIGAYTSFTDRSLVGRKLPEGQRLISTTGMRSWKGAYLVFTLLSNSRDTDAYRQGLGIVQSGLKEIGGPTTGKKTASGLVGFTTPEAPWVLTLPGEGFEMREHQIKPDGSSGYFFMTNETTGLNVSFFIEPAQKCKSSRECRDMVQRAGFAHVGKVENIRASEVGDVSTVECFVPEAKGMPLKQQHLFAEFVVQGYWVDMHISKVRYTAEDHEGFEQLVKGTSFVPKEKGQ